MTIKPHTFSNPDAVNGFVTKARPSAASFNQIKVTCMRCVFTWIDYVLTAYSPGFTVYSLGLTEHSPGLTVYSPEVMPSDHNPLPFLVMFGCIFSAYV
jgi:hypothetical protein